MNEVDKLYNEWREEERSKAEHKCRHCMRVYQNQCEQVPDYIKSRIVLEASETLNKLIEDTKNNWSQNVETEMYITYAEEELKRRANKRSVLAAKVRNEQLKTRKETFLEQAAEQNDLNELNSGRTWSSAILPFGHTAETKTISTEGKNTMEKTMNVNTKIDIAALIQAKMAEKMMDAVGDGKDIPLTKLTIMQSLANGGSINVTELIRAKQTEKLLKDLNENKDLSIGRLLTYQALTSEGGFDVNALIQAQFVEKLFADDENAK